MIFDPADKIQDLQHFGEFGGVNPSVTDSVTYTFLTAKDMQNTFEGNSQGCHLYSRHSSPSALYLGEALAAMENTEAAHVTSSGMGAIATTLLQICSAEDHIVCARTVYGGTYALLKNVFPKFNIQTEFVDIRDLKAVESAIKTQTKVLYCETLSNPILEVSNIKELSRISKAYNIILIVDNTFTPMIISPVNYGADIVLHSLTKFINGNSDTIAGSICASKEFIDKIRDVNQGVNMLFGPVLDSNKSASILKNIHTLHIRMEKHSYNASYLASRFEKVGISVVYPGLKSHPDFNLFSDLHNKSYGFGGLLTIDVGSVNNAYKLMELIQSNNLGYLAVSLGFYKTLFSAPGSSTSSEIPKKEQEIMNLSQGLIRFSIGLDQNIERTWDLIEICLKKCNLLA